MPALRSGAAGVVGFGGCLSTSLFDVDKRELFSEITLVRDSSRQPKTLSLLNILSILGRDYYLRPFFVVIVFFGAKRAFVVEII